MTEEELKEIEDRWRSNLEPSKSVPGAFNVSFDPGLIEKEVPKLINEIRRLKKELIRAYDPVDNAGQIQ